jgi:hypothetical protein
LSIEDQVPDHSAFSRARNERFGESDIFRRVFDRVVKTCIAAGLFGGEGFAVDASLIVADADAPFASSPPRYREFYGEVMVPAAKAAGVPL